MVFSLLADASTGYLAEAWLTHGCAPNSCWRSWAWRGVQSNLTTLQGGIVTRPPLGSSAAARIKGTRGGSVSLRETAVQVGS